MATRHQPAPTLVRPIQAGNISLTYPTVNPTEAPFGGYKQSGIGRELTRLVRDLNTEVKKVVVNLIPEPLTGIDAGPGPNRVAILAVLGDTSVLKARD